MALRASMGLVIHQLAGIQYPTPAPVTGAVAVAEATISQRGTRCRRS